VIPPTLVCVHLGPQLPQWLATTLRQARLFNTCDIVLVAEATALAAAAPDQSLRVTAVTLEELGLSDKHARFRRGSPFDRSFRQGFWTYTSERFFVLESLMAARNLRQIVHIENDVMLYCALDELLPRLAACYPGIAATFDNDMRCVPGLLYIANQEAIGALTEFYLQLLPRIASAGMGATINDMAILGALRTRGARTIDHLPIVPPDYPGALCSASGHRAADPGSYSRHGAALGFVFDAAALGQYLGGIDPRNAPGPSHGFVNESCIFDPRLLRPRMVADRQGRRVPVVETASGLHRVANLHIHSKQPAAFLSA
jgi:hypothetical protein